MIVILDGRDKGIRVLSCSVSLKKAISFNSLTSLYFCWIEYLPVLGAIFV